MRFDNGPLLFILETVSITIKYGNIQLFETTCAENFCHANMAANEMSTNG